MTKQRVTPKRRFFSTAFLLLVIGLLLAVIVWRQNVYDYWRLHNYTPSASVAMLASEATMTDKAKHLYYINHPTIQDRAQFSTYCPAGTEQTVVLGCYKSVQRGIYVLNVDNAELSGIKQVTAAHEMLHAAYDRLGSSERKHVNAMLLDYYQHHLTDPDIKQSIQDYKKTEPNAVVNEMHSIFGTEVAGLPAGLQSYYAQYFTGRQTVVQYYQQYEAAFTNRQQQIKQYDAQLQTLKQQIDQLNTAADQQQAALKAQRERLDASRSNPSSYNQQVGPYNAAVDAYNANIRRLQALVSQYNDLVARRNAIALEERQLVQSLSAPTLAQ